MIDWFVCLFVSGESSESTEWDEETVDEYSIFYMPIGCIMLWTVHLSVFPLVRLSVHWSVSACLPIWPKSSISAYLRKFHSYQFETWCSYFSIGHSGCLWFSFWIITQKVSQLSAWRLIQSVVKNQPWCLLILGSPSWILSSLTANMSEITFGAITLWLWGLLTWNLVHILTSSPPWWHWNLLWVSSISCVDFVLLLWGDGCIMPHIAVLLFMFLFNESKNTDSAEYALLLKHWQTYVKSRRTSVSM